MARKELRFKQSPNKKEPTKAASKEIGPFRIHHKLFSLIKFILGLLLLLFVYSVTISFVKELAGLNMATVTTFISGAISFLVIYLFIWEPHIVYQKGQEIVEFIFQFVSPLMKIASYIIPIYTIMLLIVFTIFDMMWKARFVNIFMFLISFSFCFHLLMTAKTLRSKERDTLKANYLFGFSFVYIINLIILGLFLNFIFLDFSFVEFINQAYFGAENIYFALLNQLFGIK